MYFQVIHSHYYFQRVQYVNVRFFFLGGSNQISGEVRPGPAESLVLADVS